MSSTRNFMIASLFLSMVSLHAIGFSSKVGFSQTQMKFQGLTHLTPIYSDDAAVTYKYEGIYTRSPHLTPIEFVSASIQAGDMITQILGLYGEIGADYSLHGSQLFASGSLSITPGNFSPFAGIGVFYTTQNHSRLELGLNLAYFPYSLTTKSNGTLFNDYTEFSASSLHAWPTNLKFCISYPLTERFQTYAGLSYGLDFFKSQLPTSKTLPKYQSALLEQDENSTAAYIGDYYGREIDLQFNKASIGLKLNIKDI